MSLVSALDENDDLELENSSEDSETDLEIDFEKRDDRIGFSTPARLLKTTTRGELNANQVRSVRCALRMCQRTFEPQWKIIET